MMKKLFLLLLIVGAGSLLRASHAAPDLVTYNLTLEGTVCKDTEKSNAPDSYYVAAVFVAMSGDGLSATPYVSVAGPISIKGGQSVDYREAMLNKELPRGIRIFGQMRFYNQNSQRDPKSLLNAFRQNAITGLKKSYAFGSSAPSALLYGASDAFKVFESPANTGDILLGKVDVVIGDPEATRGGIRKFNYFSGQPVLYNKIHPDYPNFLQAARSVYHYHQDYLDYYSGDRNFSQKQTANSSGWDYTQSWSTFIQDSNLDPIKGKSKQTQTGGGGTGGQMPPTVGPKMTAKLSPGQTQDFDIDLPAGDYLVLSDVECLEGLQAWFDLSLLNRNGTKILEFDDPFLSWSTNEHFWRQGAPLNLKQPLQARFRLKNTGSSPTNNWLFVVPVNSAFVPFGFNKPVGVAAVGTANGAGGTLNWSDVAFQRATIPAGKWRITLTGKYPQGRAFASLIALDANGLTYDFDTTIIDADNSGAQKSESRDMDFDKPTTIIFRVWNEGATSEETLSYNVTIKKIG